jgi:hypothetical protein
VKQAKDYIQAGNSNNAVQVKVKDSFPVKNRKRLICKTILDRKEFAVLSGTQI